MTTEYSPMQGVKRRLFALRNGIVADALRRGGSPFRIIFGLTLPQLLDVASATGKSAELAAALWNDRAARESMLLAPMIMPIESFSQADAMLWAAASPCAETTDILCHRLLRRLPDAEQLAVRLSEADRSDTERYAGARLAINLHAMGRDVADLLNKLAGDGTPAGTVVAQYLSQL